MAEPAKKPKVTVRKTPEETWDYLINGHTGILITLRKDGVPIAMPLWYAVVDKKVYVRTRGKKVTRVKNDPRAAFLVESGEKWAELEAVHLTGKCHIIQPSADLKARFDKEMERKYARFRTNPKVQAKETQEAYATADWAFLEFTPDERILTWENSKVVS